MRMVSLPQMSLEASQNWRRACSSIEFLGDWERLSNSDDNRVEFDTVEIRMNLLLADAGVLQLEGKKP
jgi:hypothetical protein